MTHMRHVRPETTEIQDWEQANAVLAELGELERQKTTEETRAAKLIDGINAELTERTRPLCDRRELLERRLEAFVTAHRPDLNGKKSRNLNHGTVGFRQSVKLDLEADEADVIQAIVEGDIFDAESVLRQKVSLDKVQLATYSDEDLASIGAVRRIEDRFYYKVRVREERQRVVSHPDGGV